MVDLLLVLTMPSDHPLSSIPVHGEPVCCPVCKAFTVQCYARPHGCRVATDQEFEYLECVGCGSVFLSPKTPQPSGIYDDGYFVGRKGFLTRLENAWVDFGFRLRLRRAPRLAPGEKILDVGCGNGAWLAFLAGRGLEVHGLDPSEEAVAACRARGLHHVVQGDLWSHPLPPASFDMVTAIHCLEHDADPVGFLRGAAALVRPGGWLGLAIPNIASWEARRARGLWYHLDPPYHLCLPTPAAMRQMLAASALTEIRVSCPVLDCCQSVGYAFFRRPSLSLPVALALLPPTMIANGFLALRRRAGVIEFWARKPDR